MIKRISGRASLAALAAVAALTLTACGSAVVGGTGTAANAPDSTLTVSRLSGHSQDRDVERVARNALTDIMAFWRANYPKVSGGKPLPPLRGGLYPVDGRQVVEDDEIPAPARNSKCASNDVDFAVDNAGYCGLDDSIVWDTATKHLASAMAARYGSLSVALIFAHEFGHAIQERLGLLAARTPTIDKESQADCAAGAWAAAVLAGQEPHFRSVTPADLDNALVGVLDGRDSTDTPQSRRHGDGFDRISAVADGMQHGVTYCYSKDYYSRTFTERSDVNDDNNSLDRTGNTNRSLTEMKSTATRGDGGSGLIPDLNRYWSAAAKTVDKTFFPPKIVQAEHPACGGESTSEFDYCPTNNTIYYSNSAAQRAYYSLPGYSVNQHTGDLTMYDNSAADFGLGTMFAFGYGMAIRHQLFGKSTDDDAAILAASCYTGAYLKDINMPIDPSGARQILLGPSDLDEATVAILRLVATDQSYGDFDTTGPGRIQAFISGYNKSLSVC